MELTVENLEGGFRCIKLSGRLDLKGTQAADPQFTAQVGALKQSVIVDLSGVDSIDAVTIEHDPARALALLKGGGAA